MDCAWGAFWGTAETTETQRHRAAEVTISAFLIMAAILSDRGTMSSPRPTPMEKQQMIDEIKEFFQSFLAPQLEGIRGDIRALDSKLDANIMMLDARIAAVDTKVESYRRELLSEIRRVEDRVDVRLSSMDQRFDAMDQKLDALRRELLAEIRAAVK